jgi:iron complex outermembrane receptor protein
VEHNNYAGFAIQPSIRFLWVLSPNQMIWGGIARADRSPSRADSDVEVNLSEFPGPNGTPTEITLFGNPKLKAENVIANELGYRAELTKSLSIDLTTFYNSYDDLRSVETGMPFIDSDPSTHLVIPLVYQNGLSGETNGIEAAAIWKATSIWKLIGGYTWFHERLHSEIAGGNAGAEANAGQNPQQQWNLMSYYDLPRNFEFDAAVYYVSSLSNPDVRAHTRLDSRLGWRPTEHLEFSLVGQNLLSPRHYEFDSSSALTNATQVKRSFYGKVTWRF